MSQTPTILSVIIPAYNAERTIDPTLESLDRITQGHRPGVEVIVVNDGSTDETRSLVEQSQRRICGFDWRIIDQPNRGLSGARNTALRAARGEWIYFLDADDQLTRDPVDIIKECNEATVVAVPVVVVKNDRVVARFRPRLTRPANFLDRFTAANPYPVCSLIVRRTCIDGPFDEHLKCLEDWHFWFCNPRIFEKMEIDRGSAVAVINIHGANMSARFSELGEVRERIATLMRNRFGHRLNSKQRHNLSLQQQIGKLQNGKSLDPLTFLAIPSNPILYGKMLVYFALQGRLGVVSRYR